MQELDKSKKYHVQRAYVEDGYLGWPSAANAWLVVVVVAIASAKYVIVDGVPVSVVDGYAREEHVVVRRFNGEDSLSRYKADDAAESINDLVRDKEFGDPDASLQKMFGLYGVVLGEGLEAQ